MGSNRRFAYCLMSGLAVLSAGISPIQAQLTQSKGPRSANPAYDQPLAHEQYLRDVQTPFVINAPLQSGHQNLDAPLSIRERASAMLQIQQKVPSSDNVGRFDWRLVLPNRGPNRGRSIGYSRMPQDNPLGPPPANGPALAPTEPANSNPVPQERVFQPFAEPPINDDPQENQQPNPLAEGQNQPEKVTPPAAKQVKEPEPGAIPFPPELSKQEPPMRDPVLPPDPTSQVPTPADARDQPGTGQPPNEIPQPPSLRWDDVYSAPLDHPNQVVPYPMPPGMMPPGIQSPMGQPYCQPYYQPDYQSNVGVPAPPGYQYSAVPTFAPPTFVEGPPNFSDGVVLPEDTVYSSVVSDCSTCQTCDSGCACDSGCPNFYFSSFVGYTGLRDLVGQSNGVRILADGGTGFGFALGRPHGRHLRSELEFAYRNNDISGVDIGAGVAPMDGKMEAFSGMANAYWEFVNFRKCCLKPYFGVGIGFVSINTKINSLDTFSFDPSISNTDSSFAFQWMAGINYKAYRNMDVFAEYRFFQADSFRFDSAVLPPDASDGYNFDTDNVFFGIRCKF